MAGSTPAKPFQLELKPTPLFVLRRYGPRHTSDYDIFCRANATLTWDRLKAHVILRRLLGWTYHFVPDLRAALRLYGKDASRTLGRSQIGQAIDIVRLANRTGMWPKEYYEFGLARFGGSTALREFVPHRFYSYATRAAAEARLLRFPSAPNLKDKVVFEKECLRLNVPSVETLAVVGADGVTDIHGVPGIPDLGDRDLFVKPRSARQGQGTLRLDSLGGGLYRDADGNTFTASALLTHLIKIAAEIETDLFLQVALRNSGAIEAFAGRALATMRIITVPNEAGEPEVAFAALRTGGAADSIVDNYHARGIAFSLDAETGELGEGRRLFFPADPHFYRIQPVTGATVAGTLLPGWQEAKALALRMHKGCPHLLICGWDLALTPDGARVVEANIPPGIPIVQMQRGFLGTRYSALLAMHLREWLDTDGKESRSG